MNISKPGKRNLPAWPDTKEVSENSVFVFCCFFSDLDLTYCGVLGQVCRDAFSAHLSSSIVFGVIVLYIICPHEFGLTLSCGVCTEVPLQSTAKTTPLLFVVVYPFCITSAAPVQNMPVQSGAIAQHLVLLLAASLRPAHPKNFTLTCNTPAMTQFDPLVMLSYMRHLQTVSLAVCGQATM